ncbi:hypothetical protein [Streptomyces sp. NPDC001068]|uniref:hypothetical protein n=1 Tax=Streptomyces sp. NPDC001068 TaxID=3364544 RepID=UPI0036B9A22A
MRIRVAATVISGAAVLSALVVPVAAQAAEGPDARAQLSALSAHSAGPAKSANAAGTARTVRPMDAVGDITFSKGVVNGGKDIVLGTTTRQSVTATYTATSANGVALTEAFLWQGTDPSSVDTITGALGTDDDPVCTESTTQTGVYSCKAVFHISAATDMKGNGAAGTWKFALGGYDLSANASFDDSVTTAKIKKASKLTVDAAPEPVKKGKTVTVTGKLTRANWDTGTYGGYSGQKVVLQFRKKTSSTYTNVKGITAGTGGALKTTTTATVDGYYRFSFATNATTGASTATGDYVDVK